MIKIDAEGCDPALRAYGLIERARAELNKTRGHTPAQTEVLRAADRFLIDAQMRLAELCGLKERGE